MTTGQSHQDVTPKNLADQESYEERDAFCRWLYDTMYETDTDAGLIARQLHLELLGYHVIRNRAAWTWERQIAKREMQVDAKKLMSVWNEWRRHYGTANGF